MPLRNESGRGFDLNEFLDSLERVAPIWLEMAEDSSNDPRIVRDGGYQGIREPGPPDRLFSQQVRPVDLGENE